VTKGAPDIRVDIMLPQSGEVPVDISARIFLDNKQFGGYDPERTVLDCLMELSRAIREGRGIVKRVVVKSYCFVTVEDGTNPQPKE